MPKRLFVISDMQFNVAAGHEGMTNHESLKLKYEKSGEYLNAFSKRKTD
jgi:hypothetical protein